MKLHSFHLPHLNLHVHLRRSIRNLDIPETANHLDSLRNTLDSAHPHRMTNFSKRTVRKSVRISLTHVTMLFDNSKGILEEPLTLLASTLKLSPLYDSDGFADFESGSGIAAPVTSHRSLDLSDSRFSTSIARYERKASIAARRETCEQMDPSRDLYTGIYLGSSEAMVNTLFNLSMPNVESSLSPPPAVLKTRPSRQSPFHFRSPRRVLSRATRAARHKIHAARSNQSPNDRKRNIVCT